MLQSEEVQQPNTEPTYETPVPLANQEKPYASLNGLQKRHSDMQQALQNPISVNEGIKKPGVVGKIVAEIEKKAQQTQQTQRRTPKPTGMIR
ncbi:MAG UNVERIFIED_CONTAM: hypothetical protein LVQ98_04480 [Rickettsiaceae bacterium]|jgi:hypothetical protein